MFNTRTKTPASAQAVQDDKGGVVHKLNTIASLQVNECLVHLKTGQAGITDEEANARLKEFGKNEISAEKSPHWYIQLVYAFLTPFNGVLLFVALLSLVTDIWYKPLGVQDYVTALILSIMILLSSLIRFWQEYKSGTVADRLKKMITTSAAVLRKNQEKRELDISQLVPGDIVFLSSGDMIPADCRVIHSKDLFVSQSLVSGESLPREKSDRPVPADPVNAVFDLSNICLMGSNVVSGSATAVVIATGSATFLGSFSKSIATDRAETGFDKGINSVSWLLFRFTLVMVPLVFLLSGITKGNWFEAFLFSISVAVGLTPEMLPMIVSTNLARGALMMSRRKVIVKKLQAIQNLGAMDVLCTDKTGTLTLDKIVLQIHQNVNGDTDDEVLKWAYMNSYYQTGLKNLLDEAVLNHYEVQHLLQVKETYKKVDEIPFDFERRRMSVVLQQNTGKHVLICKGALEEMLPLCSHAFDPGEDRELHVERDAIIPLNEEMQQKIIRQVRKQNENGLRTLLVAIREFDPREAHYTVSDETGLILTGFIGFLDPAKPSAKPSLEAIRTLNVQVKVLTGDNPVISKKICQDVGIEVGDQYVLGPDIDGWSDEELGRRLGSVTLFAKLNPMQKVRIVRLLKAQGRTVGFLGDGINDAAALRMADVGISVDSGADIAKESSDIILLEKDLMVLRAGIVYGRRTYGNIIKYIKMAASSNFGNMLSVLGASTFLKFLPLMPLQILTQNLLYDLSQVSIPWDRMDEEFINEPQKWNANGIRDFMLSIGPISSLFDYVTFAVLYFVFDASTPARMSIFQTGWFTEGLLSQILIVHMIRTRKIPFIQSVATTPVLLLTGLVMLMGLYLPYVYLAPAFGFTPMPAAYYIWLVLILVSYCVVTQFVKQRFIKRKGFWL